MLVMAAIRNSIINIYGMMSAEDLINLMSIKNNAFKTIVMSLGVCETKNVVSVLFSQNPQWLRGHTPQGNRKS